jgi:DNA repair protein RadC
LSHLSHDCDPDYIRRAGLSLTDATRLQGVVELARRIRVSESRTRLCLSSAEDIFRYLEPRMEGLRHEVFHVLCFNPRNVLLRDARIAEGAVDSCPVDPRRLFAEAVKVKASAIVLAHNHPSGDPSPSAPDLALTRQLEAGAFSLGIKLLDHLVLGDGVFWSLLERGQLGKRTNGPGRLTAALES